MQTCCGKVCENSLNDVYNEVDTSTENYVNICLYEDIVVMKHYFNKNQKILFVCLEQLIKVFINGKHFY